MWFSASFWWWSAVLFILGSAVGSFVDVVVYRSVRGKDWVKGRSRCDHCAKLIKWFDNIPLLSYLWLGGKSRCCGKRLSRSHPIIELMVGVLFVWWYWGGTLFFELVRQPWPTIQPIFWLVVGVLLLGILVADWLYLIIPDELVFTLIGLATIYRLVLVAAGQMRWQDLGLTLLGAGLWGGVFYGLWRLTKGKGMGFGDIKLVVAMALLLGWPRIWVGIFLAFILGSLVGILLIVLKKKKFGQQVPFGPFLVAGTMLGLLFGQEIWSWYWIRLGA